MNLNQTVFGRVQTLGLLAGEPVLNYRHSAAEQLLWVQFPNASSPRELMIAF